MPQDQQIKHGDDVDGSDLILHACVMIRFSIGASATLTLKFFFQRSVFCSVLFRMMLGLLSKKYASAISFEQGMGGVSKVAVVNGFSGSSVCRDAASASASCAC